MSPGVQLAATWVVRVLAWGIAAYGLALLAVAAMIAWRVPPDQTPIHPAVPLVAGAGFAAVGVYMDRRAAGALSRRRREGPRGFDVIGPSPRP